MAIYTGRHEAKKEEPKTPPLGKRLLQGLIVAIPGGVFGSLFGLTGVLAGAAGGYALGFFATNQGSDKPSEDEALSARAREAIKLLQDRAPHQLLQKLNVSVHELLSDPKAAATAHSDIWRLKGMFAAMTNEAAAHPV